jgi:hypothetical protein
MPDLHGWITQQIDTAAERADRWHDIECDVHATTLIDATVIQGATLCDCGGPAAVLRRCAVDRRLLAEHAHAGQAGPCPTLIALAQSYGPTDDRRSTERSTGQHTTCGAWGGCTLPPGHNRGQADIPENHRLTGMTDMLTEAERAMLIYALDQAQERIWSDGGVTADDRAALDSLHRMADQPPAAVGCRYCTQRHPQQPCIDCGHEYHGHAAIDSGRWRCLTCPCDLYRAGLEPTP